MKGKSKTQKGITLVALIITIIILLTLAVVAIGAIQDTQIISFANNAAKDYNTQQGVEQGILGGYNSELGKYDGKGGSGNPVDPDEPAGEGGSSGQGGTTPNVKIGDTVEYDSNNDGEKEDWIVLTAEEGLVEIVSAAPMGSLTLGYEDTTVQVTTDLDGDGEVGDGKDKAIASYNNAITTINNYCKSLVIATDNEGVRSVGAASDISGDYSSSGFNNWFKNSSTVKVKAGDEYYTTDFNKLTELGIAATGVEYWMASRYVAFPQSYDFYVRCVDSNGSHYNGKKKLWEVWYTGAVYGATHSCAVRPVIINPTGI